MDSRNDVRRFVSELLDTPKRTITVGHSGAIATWALTLDSIAKSNVSDTTAWGTLRALASDLIDDALNGRAPTIYDQIDEDTRVLNQQETIAAREAQQKIKDRFSEWIWQDDEPRTPFHDSSCEAAAARTLRANSPMAWPKSITARRRSDG